MAETTKKTADETVEISSAWDVKRTVFLERGQASEEQSQFVCVNGRTFQVPKGKTVEVPLPVYEALENARLAREEAYRQAKEETDK